MSVALHPRDDAVAGDGLTDTADYHSGRELSLLQVMSPALAMALLCAFGLAASWYIEVSDDGPILSVLSFILIASALRTALYHPQQYPVFIISYIPFSLVFPFNLVGDGGGVNMTNILLLLAFVAWISSRKERPQALRLGAFEVLVGLWILIGLTNILVLGMLFDPPMADAGYYTTSELVLEFKRWAMPVLVFLLIRGIVATRVNIRRCVIALMWVVFLTACLTWYQGVDVGGRGSIDESRIGGVLLQANSMGAFLSYYGLVLLAFYLKSRHWLERVSYLTGLLVALRATLYTFSRGSYLSWAAGGTVALLMSNPLYLVGGVGAGYVLPQLVPESVGARVSENEQNAEGEIYNDSLVAGADKSVDFRFILWRGGFRMTKSYPLLGVGMARFKMLVERFTDVQLTDEDPRDAHNAYILTAAELGIPALVVMVLMLLTLLGTAIREYVVRSALRDRGLALAVIGMTIATMVSCIWGSRFDDGSIIGLFWVMAALLMVQRRLGPASREAH